MSLADVCCPSRDYSIRDRVLLPNDVGTCRRCCSRHVVLSRKRTPEEVAEGNQRQRERGGCELRLNATSRVEDDRGIELDDCTSTPGDFSCDFPISSPYRDAARGISAARNFRREDRVSRTNENRSRDSQHGASGRDRRRGRGIMNIQRFDARS